MRKRCTQGSQWDSMDPVELIVNICIIVLTSFFFSTFITGGVTCYRFLYHSHLVKVKIFPVGEKLVCLPIATNSISVTEVIIN